MYIINLPLQLVQLTLISILTTGIDRVRLKTFNGTRTVYVCIVTSLQKLRPRHYLKFVYLQGIMKIVLQLFYLTPPCKNNVPTKTQEIKSLHGNYFEICPDSKAFDNIDHWTRSFYPPLLGPYASEWVYNMTSGY